jgi:hypothetical protein
MKEDDPHAKETMKSEKLLEFGNIIRNFIK